MTVLRTESKTICRIDVMALIMEDHDFKAGEQYKELYCLRRWLKIEKEGESDYFFAPVAPTRSESGLEEPEEIPEDAQT